MEKLFKIGFKRTQEHLDGLAGLEDPAVDERQVVLTLVSEGA